MITNRWPELVLPGDEVIFNTNKAKITMLNNPFNQKSKSHLLLGIIIAESQLEHPVSSQFLQSLVDINTNLIVMFIRFVTKSKHLKRNRKKTLYKKTTTNTNANATIILDLDCN